MHQLQNRISAVISVQPVYTTVSACIRKDMVGTPAAYSDVASYFDVAANTPAIPCTIGAHA